MKVFSFAPLPVGVLPWHDPDPCVTVITKLTLILDRHGLVIAPAQEPLCHPIPSLFGAETELHHPSDFAPRKARCDVLLTGSAYAAMPLSAIGARIQVGRLHKRFFALAGEATTAIPLSLSYLRQRRRFDAEEVTVAALSPLHPDRAKFAGVEAAFDGAPLARMAIPRDFDFAYFNAAPDDQQVDFVGPGTTISLEGLSPDGAPVSGVLPETWPQIFALTPEGAQMVEIPLTCDTLWIDTDRRVCELTLRGTWQAPAPPRTGKKERPQARVMPIGFVVRLSDPADRRSPPILADLPHAASSSAIRPEDVERADIAIEEIEPEPEEIEAEPLEDEATPAPDPALERRALGRLGAMQLMSARPAEMPSLPRDPKAPPPAPPAPVVSPPPVVAAPPALQPPTFGAPPLPPQPPGAARPPTFGEPPPKRSPTLTMSGPAPRRSRTLPFVTKPSDTPQPLPPQAAPGGSSRRPKTLDLSPGARSRAALPFTGARDPSVPSGAPPIDPETARARFLALTSGARPDPVPPPLVTSLPVAPPVFLGALTVSEPSAILPVLPNAPPAATPPSPALAPPAFPAIPVVPAPPSSPPSFAAPEMPDAPWAARAPSAPELLEAAPISRVGALPLGVDAAIQQEIWAGAAPLHEILARHGIGEVEWRDHLRRRDEALRDEASRGAIDRASAARQALERARRPQDDPEEPALDLAAYAAIRAVFDGSRDAAEEAAHLAARGLTRDAWDRDHRLYRRMLRDRPALADRFREALAEAKTALAAAPAEDRKKPAAKRAPRGAPRAEKKT